MGGVHSITTLITPEIIQTCRGKWNPKNKLMVHWQRIVHKIGWMEWIGSIQIQNCLSWEGEWRWMWWIWVMHPFIAQTEQIASSGWSDRDHNCRNTSAKNWLYGHAAYAIEQQYKRHQPDDTCLMGIFSFSHISILYLMRISLSVSGVIFCSEFFYNAAKYDEIDSNQPRWINGNHANSFDPWHLAIPASVLAQYDLGVTFCFHLLIR